jgi:hypothetical protein
MKFFALAALRWLLVLVALSVSTFASFVLAMGLVLWPDRSVVATLLPFGFAPRATIEAVHHLDFFIAILIWVVPPTCAIALAARTEQRRAIRLGISIAVLLFATLSFALGRHGSRIDLQCIAVVAALIVLTAIGLSFSKLKFPRIIGAANLLAILLLFLPAAVALVRKTNAPPPQPKELWSTVLQQEQWWQQSMNTGSEYAATRQVLMAGDRVVVVFDAGLTSSQTPQDKWPISNYRIVSLDAKTGTKKNELNLTGRWGGMPYIYVTKTGQIDVQSNPLRHLNPDLSPATASNDAASPVPKPNSKQATCPNCDPPQYALTNNKVLQMRPKQFRVLDDRGNVLRNGNLVEWGAYAGASADGRRFAIQSSYTEGDPDFVVYEYFTIYDVGSGEPVATIHIKDLPERQSWSAFSPDGRYFIAGSPNKLTMYLLP